MVSAARRFQDFTACLKSELLPVVCGASRPLPLCQVYTKDGITAGQLQKLQADAAKWMAMAGLLCESAGWWPLATLYSNLAQTAAAGVRHELLDLMRVPAMNPAKARLLHRAGVRDPHALATSDEAAVARALAPGAAQQMRSRRPPPKPGAGQAEQQQQQQQQQAEPGAGRAQGAYAAAGMAARAAKTLVRSARDLILGEAAQVGILAGAAQLLGRKLQRGQGQSWSLLARSLELIASSASRRA